MLEARWMDTVAPAKNGLRSPELLPGGLAAAALPLPEHMLPRDRPKRQHAAVHRTAAALHVLVVEDDPPVRHACAEIAASLGHIVETADSLPSARAALRRNPVDILLLDLKLPGGGGLTLLEEIRETHPRIASVVMTAFASVNSAVEAMRTGAGDYLAKPFTLEDLTKVLGRAAERRHAADESRLLHERLSAGRAAGVLVGQSPAMDKLLRMVSKVAYTSHPVLILGEGGTGKELVARAIHTNGSNAASPFLPVDCGSLAPALMESELFGHAPGALPGMPHGKTGLLVAAGKGTVFFDEIADLPLDLQAKLLRALHEKEVRPVGATAPIPFEARVLAATSRDLATLVETGRFRKDLFYRLNVVNLRVPALRERTGDIPVLAAQLLERLSRERGIPYTFSDSALRLMVQYEWPGNVRELEHTIERACALSSGPLVHLADLPTPLQEHLWQHRQSPPVPKADVPEEEFSVVPIFELERQAILNTLRQLQGDKLRAAKLLGIGKTTLYRKLKEYGVTDEVMA